MHCLEDEGKGSKGSEQQAVTKDESEWVERRGERSKIVEAKQRRQRLRESESERGKDAYQRRNETNKEKEDAEEEEEKEE